MKTIKTDIIVIGGGSGGLSVAAGAAQMGADVVLFEDLDELTRWPPSCLDDLDAFLHNCRHEVVIINLLEHRQDR